MKNRTWLVLLAGAASLAAPVGGSADEVEVPRCIEVSKSMPYRGYGYDHNVHVRSTCDDAMDCTLSTDVTPQNHRITVAPGGERVIRTRTGSPSSTFEAIVSCEEAR